MSSNLRLLHHKSLMNLFVSIWGNVTVPITGNTLWHGTKMLTIIKTHKLFKVFALFFSFLCF